MDTLKAANRMLTKMKEPRSWFIRPLGCGIRDVVFVAATDASLVTMPRGGSQAGLAVVMAHPNILVGEAAANILETMSHRIQRVVRSSLGAEMASATGSMEHGEFARAAWAEMTLADFELAEWKLHAAGWRLYLAIDAKTGYDVLQRDMVPQDRRTAIDAAALKQNFCDESYRVFVKWMPGPQRLADALTKQAGNGMLGRVMEECRWSLVETPEV